VTKPVEIRKHLSSADTNSETLEMCVIAAKLGSSGDKSLRSLRASGRS